MKCKAQMTQHSIHGSNKKSIETRNAREEKERESAHEEIEQVRNVHLYPKAMAKK